MNLHQLAQNLINGTISLLEWEAEMKEFIRTIHREATILAMGGAENVTPAIWGYEGSLVKKQYQFLRGFVDDIKNSPDAWLNGRLETRMSMYAKADYNTFEKILQRRREMEGNTEERRILGVADHCECCLGEASKGWRAIGTLKPIGECTCLTNCRCTKEYR